MNNNIDALIFTFVVTFYSFSTSVFFDFIPPDLPPTCHSDRRSFRSRILRLRTFCPEKVCPERFSCRIVLCLNTTKILVVFDSVDSKPLRHVMSLQTIPCTFIFCIFV